MNELQKSFIENSPSFLMHYNHNHDPKTGRFTNSLFVSGSSKTQTKDSGYYRKKLPKQVRERLKESMRNGDRIIVGDAPGVDRQVQDYLKKKRYDNVEVYGPGKQVRYSADSKWKTNPIDAPEFQEGSKEWLAKKDKAMTDASTKGLAIVLDEGSKATRNNVERLRQQGKPVEVFQLSKSGKSFDNWIGSGSVISKQARMNEVINRDEKYQNLLLKFTNAADDPTTSQSKLKKFSKDVDDRRKLLEDRYKYAVDHWDENLIDHDIHNEQHYIDILDIGNRDAQHDVETDHDPNGNWHLEEYVEKKKLRKKYNRI